MIHPETREDSALAEEAQAAFIRTHPHRDTEGFNNDLAAIEWRHGYITAIRTCRSIRPNGENA